MLASYEWSHSTAPIAGLVVNSVTRLKPLGIMLLILAAVIAGLGIAGKRPTLTGTGIAVGIFGIVVLAQARTRG